MKNYDAKALSQNRFKVFVNEVWVGESVPAIEVGRNHVALHRPWSKQRYLNGEVVEFGRLMFAGEFALPRAFDLKDAKGVCRSNGFESLIVCAVDVVEFEFLAANPRNFSHRIGHRALHAHAENIELQHSHRVHVVFVELTHRQPHAALLNRCHAQQIRVAENNTARMHRDVTR